MKIFSAPGKLNLAAILVITSIIPGTFLQKFIIKGIKLFLSISTPNNLPLLFIYIIPPVFELIELNKRESSDTLHLNIKIPLVISCIKRYPELVARNITPNLGKISIKTGKSLGIGICISIAALTLFAGETSVISNL